MDNDNAVDDPAVDDDVYSAWGYARPRREPMPFNEEWQDSDLPLMPWNW